MRHSHPAVYRGEACEMTTAAMIRAGARGEKIVCTDEGSRTALYQANSRAGCPCRIVLQNGRIYLYPKGPIQTDRGSLVIPAWACSRGCDCPPEAMGNTTGPWSGPCGRFGRADR